MNSFGKWFLSIGGVVVAAAAVFAVLNREDLTFYWNLWQASRAGTQFYESYEHIGRDIAYHAGSDERLDVYSPSTGNNHPVLIFIHGGGWDSYNKLLFTPVAMKLLPHDLVVVIPNYTLYPDAGYAEMTDQVAAAVAWTVNNIADYGGDPDRIVLSGHSAGGHLAGLVAMDERWLAAYDLTLAALCRFIGLSGVYDVKAQMAFERAKESTAPVMTAVMGGEDNFTAASPVTYVTADRPPVHLIHGDADTTVPISISQEFATVLAAAGIPNELIVYPGKGHTDFLFEALTDADAPIVPDIVAFVQSCAQ
ncbi:alpha/beta fold hydrolase [bacterium]|nr:alpha/beta fold hydrolase [bacterium]